ncbi:MAG: hypothetical protein ABR575_01340 [Actinomycetota bacterium]
MSDRAAARLAWAVFAFVALVFVVATVSGVLVGPHETTDWGTAGATGALFGLAMFTFPAVGVLIAARQPRNAVGWILLAIGFVWGSGGITENYIQHGLVTRPGSLPGAELVLAWTAWTWVPGVGLIGTYLLLLFPDGRLPTARWRPLAWLCAIALVVPSIVILLGPPTMADVGFPRIPNPLHIESWAPVLDVLMFTIVLIPLCIVGCAASVVQRFRRARGQQRLQLKWLATGAGAAAAAYLIAMGASLPFWVAGQTTGFPLWLGMLQNVALFSFALIPLGAGIAMLKYRLYDIDLLINRTLVYTVLTATLTGIYLLLVTVLQGSLRPITGQSNVAIAASTLTVAALFRPARVRIQAFIDRRFYRRKYDAAQTLERFSTRLRDELDLDTLTAELLEVIGDVMQPSRVSLWLREPRARPAE